MRKNGPRKITVNIVVFPLEKYTTNHTVYKDFEQRIRYSLQSDIFISSNSTLKITRKEETRYADVELILVSESEVNIYDEITIRAIGDGLRVHKYFSKAPFTQSNTENMKEQAASDIREFLRSKLTVTTEPKKVSFCEIE